MLIQSKSSIVLVEGVMDESLLIHPGKILSEEFLIPHHLTANRLATRLGVPPNSIIAIINGTRGVSGPMSKLLGHAFGLSDEFFANLQTRYELDLATIEASRDETAARRLERASELAKELSLA
jgi:addiction module HigA family antidote